MPDHYDKPRWSMYDNYPEGLSPKGPVKMPTQHDSKHEELDYSPGEPPREWRQAPGRNLPPPPYPKEPARLHRSTYEYLRPSDEQVKVMSLLRTAARQYSDMLEEFLPDGPDKTFILRAHRANAMWVNVAVTRLADGTPRP